MKWQQDQNSGYLNLVSHRDKLALYEILTEFVTNRYYFFEFIQAGPSSCCPASKQLGHLMLCHGSAD